MSQPSDTGHAVLAVAVPEMEQFVRQRTAHYDRDYLSPDPHFAHAHVTLLSPWLQDPTGEDLERVDRLCRESVPFGFELSRVATFPDGTIHLRLEPDARMRQFGAALRDCFPGIRPYDGLFGEELIPHVTVDAVGPGVDEQVVRGWLDRTLPLPSRAERVQYQWWQAANCHLRHEWRLGSLRGAS